ncbi:hypothetical protein RN2511_018650 [Rhodococcus sp. NKCM2511]|nr:hypothetical protein RN2511_018650 [Rhodococcus sp. NKCM2511]
MAPIPSLGSEFLRFRLGSAPRFRIPDADGSQVSETGELIERTARIYALRRNPHPAEEVSIPIGGVDSVHRCATAGPSHRRGAEYE